MLCDPNHKVWVHIVVVVDHNVAAKRGRPLQKTANDARELKDSVAQRIRLHVFAPLKRGLHEPFHLPVDNRIGYVALVCKIVVEQAARNANPIRYVADARGRDTSLLVQITGRIDEFFSSYVVFHATPLCAD
jgi:hypothetical protein